MKTNVKRLFAALVALLLLASIAVLPAAAEGVVVYVTKDLLQDTCGTGLSISNLDRGVKISGGGSNAQRCDYCEPIDLDGLHLVFKDVMLKTGGSVAMTFGGGEMGAWYDGALCMFLFKNTEAGKMSFIIKKFRNLAGSVVQSDPLEVDAFGEGKTLDLTFTKYKSDEWKITVNGKSLTFDDSVLDWMGGNTSSIYPALGVFDNGGAWTMKLESITCSTFIKKVEKVEQAIKAIGKVVYDDDCGILISEARAAYNALPKALRSSVSNLGVLEDAEARYEELANTPTTKPTEKPTKPTTGGPTSPVVSGGISYFHNDAFDLHLSAKTTADALSVSTAVPEEAASAFAALSADCTAYAISLKKGGKDVSADGTMLLRLPLPADAGEDVGVLRYQNGAAVPVAATVLGDHLLVAAKETGIYAVGTVKRGGADNPYTGESVLPLAIVCGVAALALIAAVMLRKKVRA